MLLKTFRLNSPDGPVKTYLGCGDVTEKKQYKNIIQNQRKMAYSRGMPVYWEETKLVFGFEQTVCYSSVSNWKWFLFLCFLPLCEDYSYERVDGSVRGEERHLAIKNFGQQPIFTFLLSTRAGKPHPCPPHPCPPHPYLLSLDEGRQIKGRNSAFKS